MTEAVSGTVNDEPLPRGTTLAPAADLRTRAGGRVLIGGAPLTIMRLSPSGAAVVKSWFAGQSVADDPRLHRLARRLERAGMGHLHPCPPPAAGSNGGSSGHPALEMTVVIPVKDDRAGLEATLGSLLLPDGPVGHGPRLPSVIVVDDGSADPVVLPARRPRTTVLRNARAVGPGPARQVALAKVDTPLVAFVDAGVTVRPDDLAALATRFADPAVVAAAPRVRSSPAAGLIGRYEERRSPLDLGPGESLVGPGRLVPYVPTACLVVRRDAVEEVGGFDPDLRYGEDVDLVWRLARLGTVHYGPDVVVHHPPRSSLGRFAAQRRSYGSAAAPLAARHGDAVSPCRLSGWSLLVVALALAGRPLLALATACGTALALRPKIAPLPDLTVESFMLTTRGHWYGGVGVLTAVARAWAPLAALGAMLLPGRRRAVAVILAAFGRRVLDGPRQPADAAADLGLGVVDDLSYCAGLWQGAIGDRSVAAVAPALISWPKPRSRRPHGAETAATGR